MNNSIKIQGLMSTIIEILVEDPFPGKKELIFRVKCQLLNNYESNIGKLLEKQTISRILHIILTDMHEKIPIFY